MDFLFNLIFIVLFALQWAILARVLISWMPALGVHVDMYNPFIKFINDVTDPILEPIRRFAVIGMVDLSPIVAWLIISVLMRVLGGV